MRFAAGRRRLPGRPNAAVWSHDGHQVRGVEFLAIPEMRFMIRLTLAAVLMLAFSAAPVGAGLFSHHDDCGCAPSCAVPYAPTCGVPSCGVPTECGYGAVDCGPSCCDSYCAPKRPCFLKRMCSSLWNLEKRKNACLLGMFKGRGGCHNDCGDCGCAPSYYEASCCAPAGPVCSAPSCCAPAGPTCCAPSYSAPTCCAPVYSAPMTSCAPTCCAPSAPTCAVPSCSAPCGCN